MAQGVCNELWPGSLAARWALKWLTVSESAGNKQAALLLPSSWQLLLENSAQSTQTFYFALMSEIKLERYKTEI